MTDFVEHPLSAIGPGPEYRNASIWLPQLYLEATRAGQFTLENRRFEDCFLEGAAILLPISGCLFDDCQFGVAGPDARALLLSPMDERNVVGSIPLLNCVFVRCRFAGVGFTGHASFLDRLGEMLGAQQA